MMRDTSKSKAYYEERIADCDEQIAFWEKKLQNLSRDKELACHQLDQQKLEKALAQYARGKELACHQLDQQKLEKALAHYALGDEIESVKKELEGVVLGLQEHRLEVGFNITLYGENVEEFCIRVLLDMDTSCLLELIEEDEKKRRDICNRDWFLHFIGSKGKNLNLERKCASFVPEHKPLKEFIATKDISYFHQYMKKHTRLRDPINTWNLQGAAVVKIMNLDKEEFKGYKYFPYDLI